MQNKKLLEPRVPIKSYGRRDSYLYLLTRRFSPSTQEVKMRASKPAKMVDPTAWLQDGDNCVVVCLI